MISDKFRYFLTNRLVKSIIMTPVRSTIIGAAAFFAIGIVFWAGLNVAIESTDNMEFCIGCHVMESTVYQEYKKTPHYQNRTGVQATCPDCHVPRPWLDRALRKLRASNEILHWMLGSIDTPEKFEAKRLTLAKHVWKSMKETDSRECRNCHSWEAMKGAKQQRRARKQHELALIDNLTCIDCHKGIAHRAVHKLLDDDEDFYDGKSDPRKLDVLTAAEAAVAEKEEAAAAAASAEEAPVAEAPGKAEAAESTPASAPSPTPSAGGEAAGGGPAWGNIPGRDIVVFYPGQTSMEWILKGSDHGGARAIKKLGDPCAECHEGEQDKMGRILASGEKAEATPIPGKRGHIKVNVKAAHDGENLYMHFQWPGTEHTPAPFVDGGKMDPDNQVKLAVMFDDGKVDAADSAGCWVTCHHDSRYMPDHPDAAAVTAAGDLAKRLGAADGITKYLKETRSEIEIKGNDDKPRGGWDKLKPASEIEELKGAGAFMDLMRVKIGEGKSESGSVLEHRAMSGESGITFSGGLADGVWSVPVTRPRKAANPGGVPIEPGKLYTVGIAIHDDYTLARFHHVSLEYSLGLDNEEAGINAIKM